MPSTSGFVAERHSRLLLLLGYLTHTSRATRKQPALSRISSSVLSPHRHRRARRQTKPDQTKQVPTASGTSRNHSFFFEKNPGQPE